MADEATEVTRSPRLTRGHWSAGLTLIQGDALALLLMTFGDSATAQVLH